MGLPKTIPVSKGGTGITTTPTNGQIPIGNGTTYIAATLTAGAGTSIINGTGSITIKADGTTLYAGTSNAGTDSYVGTTTPTIASLTTGLVVSFTSDVANTGAATFNLNSTGAQTIAKRGSVALEDGDIAAGMIVELEWDGGKWEMLNPTAAVTSVADGGTGASTAAGARTNLGLAIGTNVQAWSATLDTVTASTYTPTLTNVANLDASTAYLCQYMRVGSVVTVSGRVDVDPTTTLTDTQLGISLPVASNIGATTDAGGTAYAPAIAAQGAAILGDATNDRVTMQWKASDVTNQPMYFSFTYRII